MTPKALTYDDGKPPLAHLPWAAMNALADVQAYGQRKYGEFYNYRKGIEVSRNLSCALRHIRDYMEGHEVDHESGINPLAHALCRIAFTLQNLADGTAIDDRYKGDGKSEVERLRAQVVTLQEMVEGVACGRGLTCEKCGKKLPCNCEHEEGEPE